MEENQRLICGKCGRNLSYEVSSSTNNIIIEPCGDCLDTSESEGFDRGFDAARGR